MLKHKKNYYYSVHKSGLSIIDLGLCLKNKSNTTQSIQEVQDSI